jgi:hypothetical protein
MATTPRIAFDLNEVHFDAATETDKTTFLKAFEGSDKVGFSISPNATKAVKELAGLTDIKKLNEAYSSFVPLPVKIAVGALKSVVNKMTAGPAADDAKTLIFHLHEIEVKPDKTTNNAKTTYYLRVGGASLAILAFCALFKRAQEERKTKAAEKQGKIAHDKAALAAILAGPSKPAAPAAKTLADLPLTPAQLALKNVLDWKSDTGTNWSDDSS